MTCPMMITTPPHICLMAKREKVKSKSKAKSPPPPSDISSSDISDSSSYDESSDEEINMITKNLDGKTKLDQIIHH